MEAEGQAGAHRRAGQKDGAVMAIADTPDTNGLIAGLLRDMAFAQTSTHSRWGYKRAAATVMQLDAPIETYLDESGALKKIPNIGPASTRIIMEGLQLGSSPIVDQAIEASGQRADILRRRGLRSHFLSRARALAAMQLDRVNVPRLEDIRCDLQMHSDWSDGSQTLADIVADRPGTRLHALGRDRSFLRPADRRRAVDGAGRATTPRDRRAQRPLPLEVPPAQGHRSQHPRRWQRRHDRGGAGRHGNRGGRAALGAAVDGRPDGADDRARSIRPACTSSAIRAAACTARGRA